MMVGNEDKHFSLNFNFRLLVTYMNAGGGALIGLYFRSGGAPRGVCSMRTRRPCGLCVLYISAFHALLLGTLQLSTGFAMSFKGC